MHFICACIYYYSFSIYFELGGIFCIYKCVSLLHVNKINLKINLQLLIIKKIKIKKNKPWFCQLQLQYNHFYSEESVLLNNSPIVFPPSFHINFPAPSPFNCSIIFWGFCYFFFFLLSIPTFFPFPTDMSSLLQAVTTSTLASPSQGSMMPCLILKAKQTSRKPGKKWRGRFPLQPSLCRQQQGHWRK